MMRKHFPAVIIAIWFSFCSMPLGAAEPSSPKADERLSQTLAYRNPEDTIPVVIYLKDNLDIHALDHTLNLAAASKNKRYRSVVGALLQAAGETQEPIVKALEAARQRGEVVSFRTFWINNSVAATGKVRFMAEVATREDVEWMTLDGVYTRKDPVERATKVLSVTDYDFAREYSYPIRTLGLDALWDRGLTGKGILVCAIGSGIDGKHPLLAPKWRGNNGGTSAESWFDPIKGTSFPFDDEPNTPSHDTGVMGLLLGGQRTLGVAYDAQWIGAKIFDNQNLTEDGASSTKDSYIIAAFQWALDPDGNPETLVDVPDVINNSWGTLGEFKEDICQKKLWGLIDRIEAAGTSIVFSAGNEGPDPFTIGSPGSRATTPTNAFAVGAVDSVGLVASFSSRGPSACDSVSIKPDICAPGKSVVTIQNSEYIYKLHEVDGTSFAAPYVTGIIALMKQANPTLTPGELKQIILDTALDGGHPGDDYAYGMGIINPAAIFAQLPTPTSPVLYTKRVSIDDTQGGNGNGYLEPGETIRMVVPVFNSGATAEGVSALLRTSNPGVVLLDSTAFYGQIANLSGADNADDPFTYRVLPGAGLGSQLVFYLVLTSPQAGLSETLQVTLTIAPPVEGVADHDAGSFLFSFTNYGQFGGNIGTSRAGYGFRYPKDASYNMLYRGALVLGTSSLRVSDGIHDFDFQPGPGGPIKVYSDSARADQLGVAHIREKTLGSANAIGVEITQTTLVWSAQPNNDFVVLEYRIKNPFAATIKNLFVGVYADWDIPDSLPTRNAVGYDQGLALGYMYNPQEPGFGYGGLCLVTDQAPSGHRAVRNTDYVHRNYTDYLAFAFMSGGFGHAGTDSLDDWSEILASGPFSLAGGETLTVAWALIAGDDLADLEANALAARSKYKSSLLLASGESPGGGPGAALPQGYYLAQNRPNPFNPSTSISYHLPESAGQREVSLTVYDLRGRVVAELVHAVQAGGDYTVIWDGRDSRGRQSASGVYFYRLRAGDFTAVRKMVVLK